MLKVLQNFLFHLAKCRIRGGFCGQIISLLENIYAKVVPTCVIASYSDLILDHRVYKSSKTCATPTIASNPSNTTGNILLNTTDRAIIATAASKR